MRIGLIGDPKLTISLDRSDHCVADGRFAPLRLPDQVEVALSGAVNLIDQLDATAQLELGPAERVVPLPLQGASLELEVQPRTRVELDLRLRPGDVSAVLEAVTVSLTPAVRLRNPAAALRETLLASDTIGGAMQALRAALPAQLVDMLQTVTESADSAFGLELTEIALGSQANGQQLTLHVSGSLQLLGLSIPLQQLPVPALFLPDLSPQLATLAAQLGFATEGAQPVADEASPARRTEAPLEHQRARTPLELLELQGAQLRFEARCRAPATALATQSRDGIHTSAAVAASEALALSGRLALERTGNRLELRAPSALQLSCGAARADCAVSGELPFVTGPAGENAADSETSARDPSEAPRITLTLASGSKLPALDVTFERTHPLIDGKATGALRLSDLEAHGTATVDWTNGRGRLRLPKPVVARATVAPASWFQFQEGDSELRTTIGAAVAIEASQAANGWQIAADCGATLEHRLDGRATPIPELSLPEGLLGGRAETSLQATVRATIVERGRALDLDFAGSEVQLTLHEAQLRLDGYEVQLPDETTLTGALLAGGLTGEGLRALELELGWDMHGRPCLLRRHGAQPPRDTEVQLNAGVVSLLTPKLRSGNVKLHLSSNGRLAFSGSGEGLYGERYFNALVDPASDPLEWYQILVSDDAFAHVEAALALFSPQGATLLADARQLLITAREIARRERIRCPGDLVPRQRLACFLSLVLVGQPGLAAEIAPLIRHVTDGHGLPVTAVKRLLERELGSVASSFSLGALLNLLDLVLRPGPAVAAATADEEPPLALSATHAPALSRLPSAAQIYDAVTLETPDPTLLRRITALAPLLTVEQLSYLLRHAQPDRWDSDCIAQLQLVHQLKQRVAALGVDYGGVGHAAQPLAVGMFIGDALRGATVSAPRDTTQELTDLLAPGCALGPEQIATLLRVGLASARQGRRSQLTNRLLLDLLLGASSELTRAVLFELGYGSPRALSGLLYALLEQDQDKLAQPLDLPALLSQQLGLDVPRQVDYLAGGRRARASYYEDLSRLAEQITAGADRYQACKQHLQQLLHPAPGPVYLKLPQQDFAQRARSALAAADAEGKQCDFSRAGRSQQRSARERYQSAFARCSELLNSEPRAFQLDWFRQLWARSEEALRVLSLVRAHQRDLDQVRHWLAVRCNRHSFRGEQALLEAVVSALYYYPADRQRLLADPLVRLLIDPPAGSYDFTLVSCMGLITDGDRGAELEHAYRRLAEERGIRIVRARTGTGRPLEDNAARIVEAIEECRTPFGLIGYSQGCANALLAESMLRGGTPEQQRLLDGLVCRNMLFSSANGSAHGASGIHKFTRAMVAGEHLLKHYQASYSWEAIRAVLRGLRSALDAPQFLSMLGGAHSITFERARELHRDGQFLDQVPTSCSRTVVDDDRLPEVLEYTYHVLDALTDGSPHDTQVLLSDASPTAQRVTNDYTRAFARTDIGAMAQATHHWAPLTQEVKIVTTERDRQLAIYESPTDQLVWPWIETNARFGRISRG